VFYFLSYSSVDSRELALQIREALSNGRDPVSVWVDVRELRPGTDWDDQLVEAIRRCAGLIFLASPDSVEPKSVCKQEWTRALKYKKPVIPILCHPDAEIPFGLQTRHYLDFTTRIPEGIESLRQHLAWMHSPAGQRQLLEEQAADARRDLRRARDEVQRQRIQDDLDELLQRIQAQTEQMAKPEIVTARVDDSIRAGLERDRRPEPLARNPAGIRFLNPPPASAPAYFQDRTAETALAARFLQEPDQRILTLVARAGMGKTALVCRLLKAVENGTLPDDPATPLQADGIVYFSEAGSRRITFANIFQDLCQLIPPEAAARLHEAYRNPQLGPASRSSLLLAEIPSTRCVILLLDNSEDLVDPETQQIRDDDLRPFLETILKAPAHGLKVLITTRYPIPGLQLIQPGRQTRLDLDEGLPAPFAENILRAMDRDGKVGLREAPPALLAAARQRTRGNPRALEALFAILSADRNTTLEEILDDTSRLLPENVVEALVGEAFCRLDGEAQRTMQALAIYGRPVSAAAVDFLLQPYMSAVNSGVTLARLVNMRFVRREAGRYVLHPVDRAYALDRIPRGDAGDTLVSEGRPFTRHALWHRGAEYFRETRRPRTEWKSIVDLEPQLAEFALRCEGADFESAATVLFEIDNEHLLIWGHVALTASLHGRLLNQVQEPTHRSRCTSTLALCLLQLGRATEAMQLFRAGIELARQQQDVFREAACLNGLGCSFNWIGQTGEAIAACELACQRARQGQGTGPLGTILNNLGTFHLALGHTDESVRTLNEARDIARQSGNLALLGTVLNNLGAVAWDQQDLESARQLYRQSMAITDQIGYARFQNESRLGLARTELMDGRLDEARQAAEDAVRYPNSENLYNTWAQLGVIAWLQGDRDRVTQAFETAIREARMILELNRHNTKAQDALGLSLCGLTLCGAGDHLAAARTAFQDARRANCDPGPLHRTRRLLSALTSHEPADRRTEIMSLLPETEPESPSQGQDGTR